MDRTDAPWALKIARAHEHQRVLATAIRDYLDGMPYNLTAVELADRRSLRLEVSHPPPPSFATVIGDALHNLRSALDTRLFAIAERRGGELSERQERVLDVPLVATEAEFREQTRSWYRRLPGVAPDLERIVSRVLPFGEASGYWGERHSTTQRDGQPHHDAMAFRLQWLGQLSNIDKHRRLHLPWWSLESLVAFGARDAETAHWEISPGPWEDGDVIATLRMDDAAGVTLQGALTVVLPGQSGVHAGSAADAVENISWFVERALDVLAYEDGLAK